MSPASASVPDRPGPWWLALGLALVLPTVLTWLYFIRLAGAPAGVQQAVYAVGKTIQFALPAVFVGLILRRRIVLHRPGGRGATEGLVSGLIICALAAAIFWLMGRLEPGLVADLSSQVAAKVEGLGIATGPRYLAVAVFYSLVHSGLEEYYWRWFVYGQMRRFLRTRQAILIAALGFMAHHLILIGFYTGWGWPMGAPFAIAIAMAGAYWAWLYERSGSLVGPWISHLLVDVAIFAIGWRLL